MLLVLFQRSVFNHMSCNVDKRIIKLLETIRATKYDFLESECKKAYFYNINELEKSYIKLNINKKIVYIEVIDLIRKCSKYSPYGLLLWIPSIQKFGFYDEPEGMLYYINSNVISIVNNIYENINKNWFRDETCIKIANITVSYLQPSNHREKNNFKRNNILKHYEKFLYKSHRCFKKKCSMFLYFTKKYKVNYFLVLYLISLSIYVAIRYKSSYRNAIYSPLIWMFLFMIGIIFTAKKYIDKDYSRFVMSIFYNVLSLAMFIITLINI